MSQLGSGEEVTTNRGISLVTLTPPAFRLLTDWAAEYHYLQKKQSDQLTWRDHLYRSLASPVCSNRSTAFITIVLFVSLASVITFGVEISTEAYALSVAIQDGSYTKGLYVAPTGYLIWNYILLAFFALEFLARLVTYRSWRDAMLWVDL